MSSHFLCHGCGAMPDEMIFNLVKDGKVTSFVIEAETFEKMYTLYIENRERTNHPVVKMAAQMFWRDQQKHKKKEKDV